MRSHFHCQARERLTNTCGLHEVGELSDKVGQVGSTKP
jgi:hypothetical protein